MHDPGQRVWSWRNYCNACHECIAHQTQCVRIPLPSASHTSVLRMVSLLLCLCNCVGILLLSNLFPDVCINAASIINIIMTGHTCKFYKFKMSCMWAACKVHDLNQISSPWSPTASHALQALFIWSTWNTKLNIPQYRIRYISRVL